MDGFDAEIMQDFLTESGELLEELETDLVDLESTPDDPELLNKVFRALHTIKGSASFLDLKNLVEIAHNAENLLNAARSGDVAVDRKVMDLLLESVDLLKIQFEQLAEGDHDLRAAEPRLISDLQAATAGQGAAVAATAEAAIGATTPGGDDAGSSISTSAGPLDATVTALELDSSKEDLLEFLVSDLEQSLDEVQTKLNELKDAEHRAEAAESITDLAGAIGRNAEFFDYTSMRSLSAALASACQSIASEGIEPTESLSARLFAICQLLGEQREGLGRREVLEWPTEELIHRVSLLSDPAATTDVPEVTDAASALATDGVYSREPSTEEPAVNPENAPGDAADTSSGGAAEGEKSPQADTKQPAAKKAAAAEQTIRVEVGRLESLMNLVGELVLQKNRIAALGRMISGEEVIDQEKREQFNEAAGELDRTTGDIQVAVMRTRMQPLDKLFGRYPRLIRDLAGKTGKQIRLDIIGGDTEVDKSVIEELGDPLVHLLRNSADHGLEPPDEREQNGKEAEGFIELAASHEGSHVRIHIKDDGRGLPADKIAKKAIENGLTTEAELASLSDKEIHRFIFQPGFSTADQVSDLSGRGVGMDVVRTNIEALKGSIDVDSEPNKGTTLTIQIPLTVAIMQAMMVAIGDESYAIPLDAITEIVRPEPETVSTIGEAPVMRLRDTVLPMIDGRELFDSPDTGEDKLPFAVVLTAQDKQVALMVSKPLGQQEIVIKPLDDAGASKGPVSGATVRDDGGVSLIIDVGEVIRMVRSASMR
ncbi:MAG: chemotaxis protein CheA [Planctomycetota bacterium]